jgi:tetratricopeptide (TPR) repeat protein
MALEAAVAADPWSATAARQLAAQRFSAYETLSTQTQLRSYQEADARARALAPRRSSLWAESSEDLAAIFRATKNVEYREAAERYLERAIELYPTLARLRVQAARFWQSIGTGDRAREEAAESVRLDDAMRSAGHTDRVLDESARREMQVLADEQR